jgi:hypothetical protein
MSDLVDDIRAWLDGSPRETVADLKIAAALLQRAERALSTQSPALEENPNDLSDLALNTVRALRNRIGIDIAFVFVLRASDGNMGASIDGGTLPIDTCGILVMEGLVNVRTAVVKAAAGQRSVG